VICIVKIVCLPLLSLKKFYAGFSRQRAVVFLVYAPVNQPFAREIAILVSAPNIVMAMPGEQPRYRPVLIVKRLHS